MNAFESKLIRALLLLLVVVVTGGFKTPNNQYVVNPEANTTLIANSKLIVLGSSDQIRNLNKLF